MIIIILIIKMKIIFVFVVLVLQVFAAERCRFAHYYTAEQILKEPEPFLQEFIHWESKFMKQVGVQ